MRRRAVHNYLLFMIPAVTFGLASNAAAADRFGVPVLDLNDQTQRQVVVDQEKGQYLGHPTTCLLEDGKTMLCVYPKGHGRGAIVNKRSGDGGRSWSGRLYTPANWATSQEVPTLHRVVDAAGKKRIIMFSGLYPCRMAVTEDDGRHWSELRPLGDWGGIVTMGSVVELRTGAGNYLALFHDDGRFFTRDGKKTDTMTLYQTRSTDGGLTWSSPEAIFKSNQIHLCEPGVVRSPDGKQLAMLLRENRRVKNSHVMFSDDEGTTWTAPRELPAALTGDRHTGRVRAGWPPVHLVPRRFATRRHEPDRRRLGLVGSARTRTSPPGARVSTACGSRTTPRARTARIRASRCCPTARWSRRPTATGPKASRRTFFACGLHSRSWTRWRANRREPRPVRDRPDVQGLQAAAPGGACSTLLGLSSPHARGRESACSLASSPL